MDKTFTAEQNLGTAPVGKLLLHYSVPCVVSMVVNALYNMVDQIFVGQGVGYLGNAATSIIFPITVVAIALALWIGDGSAAYFNLKLGEGKEAEARKCVGSAVSFGIIVSIAVTIVLVAALKPLVYLFGCTDSIYTYAMEYGAVIAAGTVFNMVGIVLISLIRADGSPRYAMIAQLTGCVINFVLDPLFIFVFHWGCAGAAWATILGQIATFLIAVFYIPKFKSVKLHRSDYRVDISMCRKFMPLGISSFITQIAVVVVCAVTNNLLNLYGASSKYGSDIALAVFGIVMKVQQLLISAVAGIAAGAQPIIGYNFGAGQHGRVKEALRLVNISATVLAVAAFVAFQLFPVRIISIFGSEGALYNEFAEMSFRIFLMAVMLDGFTIAAAIFQQAIGHPGKSAAITLCRQIVFLIPAELILSAIFGLAGVLAAGAVGDVLAFLFALYIIRHETKQLAKFEAETLVSSPAISSLSR